MRKTLLLSVIILGSLLQSYHAAAQFNWQWLVGPRSSATGTAAAFAAESYFVKMDDQGNAYQAAIYSGPDTLTFGTISKINPSATTMVISKTDSNGNYIWATGTQQVYSTSVTPDVTPMNIAIDAAGNVFVYGMYSGSTSLIFDTVTLPNPSYHAVYFLAKLSPAGRVLWARNVVELSTWGYYTGGMGIDHIGNIYMSGNFTESTLTVGTDTLRNANPSGDSLDVFVIKYDGSGSPVWARSFGGNATDVVNVMTVNRNGNCYITGNYESDTMNAGGFAITGSTNYLLKVNNTGGFIYAQNLDKHIQIHGMTTDIIANEHLYMTGGIDSNVIIGTDTLQYYGGDNMWYKSGDVFTAKFDLLGNELWARSAGGDSGDVAWNLTVDTCGNVWVVGSIGGWAPPAPTGYTMNFDGHNLTLPGGSTFDPMFVAVYDNSGVYVNGTTFMSGGDDWVDIATNNNGSFYVAGDYNGTVIAGTDTLTETATEYAFLAKYKYNSTDCMLETTTAVKTPQSLANGSTSLFPNPATSEITIGCANGFPSGSSASFYNQVGRLVASYPLSGTESTISIARIIPGMYLCKVKAGEHTEVKKVSIMK